VTTNENETDLDLLRADFAAAHLAPPRYLTGGVELVTRIDGIGLRRNRVTSCASR
jgi:hypothetical protein